MELLQEAQNLFAESRRVLYSAGPVSGLPRTASEPSVCGHGALRSRLDSVHLLGGRAIRSLAMPELWEVVPRDVSTPSRTLCSLWGASLILLGQARPRAFIRSPITVRQFTSGPALGPD